MKLSLTFKGNSNIKIFLPCGCEGNIKFEVKGNLNNKKTTIKELNKGEFIFEKRCLNHKYKKPIINFDLIEEKVKDYIEKNLIFLDTHLSLEIE